MSYHTVVTAGAAFTTGLLAAFVSVVVLTTRREGRRVSTWSVAGLSGVTAVWALTLGLRVTADTQAAAVFWLRVSYVVAVPLATFALTFALHRTGTVRVTRRVAGLLAIEPILAGTLAAVNPSDVYIRGIERVQLGDGWTMGAEPGVGYLLHGVYCVLAGAVVIGLFAREARGAPGGTRRFAGLIAAGATLPAISTVLFLTDSPLSPGFDTTPIWLAVASLVVLAAMRVYGLFGVSPVAYRTVFSELEDPVVVVDGDDRIIDANPAGREAFDLPDGEGSLRDLLPEGTDELTETDRTTVTFAEGSKAAEYEVTVTELSRGERVRVLTFRNVTERRRVERRYRTYVEQSNDVLLVVDGDGLIEYVSDAARRGFGYDPGEITGQRVLGIVHPDDREEVTDTVRSAIDHHHEDQASADQTGSTTADPDSHTTAGDESHAAGDTPSEDGSAGDHPTDAGLAGGSGERPVDRGRFRVLHAEGGWRTVEAIVAVGGAATDERVLMNLRDVTDQQRYEQRLRVLNRVLRHDLRNDANVVLGYADLLLESDLPEHARERAETIRRKAARLVELGEQARAVDRTLHAAASETRPIHLGSVIDDVARQARETYPDGAVETTCPREVFVEANDLLASAIWELVANGIEHNDGTAPWVRLSVTVGDEWVYVTVTDDGPGIPESERAVLDHGTETALEHGSGLGLWLVKWTADAVDGDVSFAERTPRGSEVTLRLLPAEADEPDRTNVGDPTEWTPTGSGFDGEPTRGPDRSVASGSNPSEE